MGGERREKGVQTGVSDPLLAGLTDAQREAVEATEGAVLNEKHREGFAEIGNMTTDSEVKVILDVKLDHNLGFTKTHLAKLNELCTGWSLVAAL